MANPRNRIIIFLGILSGCFVLGFIIRQGLLLSSQSRSTSLPPISRAPLKKEKRIRNVPIHPFEEIRQRIEPGTLHRYSFVLAEGQFLDAIVEQEGVDITAQPSEPNGRKLPVIDSRLDKRGAEEIHLFARKAGFYRIEIDSGEQAGSYRFKIRSLRKASERDRLEAWTEELFHHARALVYQGTREAKAQAFEELIEAATAWEELGNQRRQADALERAAELPGKNRKQAVQTLALRRRALRLYQAIGDIPSTGRMLNWVADSYRVLGQEDREKEYYEKALRLARDHREKIGEATALRNLGTFWQREEKSWQALKAYEDSLKLWTILGDTRERIKLLNDIGLIYASLQEFEKSLSIYQQANQLLGSRGPVDLKAQIETRLAEALEKKGKWEESLAHARLALGLCRVAKDRGGEAVVLAGMSLSYQGLRNFSEARKAQEQALSIFYQLRRPEDVMSASLNRGIIFLRQGYLEQALEILEKVLEDARRQGRRGAEAIALHALARASNRNPIKARSYAEQAISIMENVRRDAVMNDLKAKYLEAISGCYDLLINTLIIKSSAFAPGEGIARAFEVSEQRKARNLLDSLSSPRPHMSPRNLAVRRHLQKEIEYYEMRMERLKLRDVSSKFLQQAQLERLEQLRDFDARSWGQEDKQSAPALISLKEAQKLLDDRTLFLVYHLGAERSFLWLVTSERVEVHTLPREQVIEKLVTEFNNCLQYNQNYKCERKEVPVAKDLGRMLLGPVMSQLGDKRLVIVPDGALHYVPFGALLEDSPQTRLRSGSLRTASRLLEGHEVLSLPSISVLAAIRQRDRRQGQSSGDLVIFADPVFREGQYEDLPNTRTEAQVIRKLVPPGIKVVEKLGYEATKEAAVSGLLSSADIVHFATHGILDRAHPELSGIVLSQLNRQGVPQDGYLRVHDIWALNIPADLVVLSACKTALGKEMRAEGLVGLTQSFFHSGSSSVLVSLWNVDDESTPEFMAVFYKALYVEHRSPAEALRAAQSWMSKHSRWRSPYYWAGFVLQGEWR